MRIIAEDTPTPQIVQMGKLLGERVLPRAVCRARLEKFKKLEDAYDFLGIYFYRHERLEQSYLRANQHRLEFQILLRTNQQVPPGADFAKWYARWYRRAEWAYLILERYARALGEVDKH